MLDHRALADIQDNFVRSFLHINYGSRFRSEEIAPIEGDGRHAAFAPEFGDGFVVSLAHIPPVSAEAVFTQTLLYKTKRRVNAEIEISRAVWLGIFVGKTGRRKHSAIVDDLELTFSFDLSEENAIYFLNEVRVKIAIYA